jgi:pimeloyl-ACP methyl ester carboxylesterase
MRLVRYALAAAIVAVGSTSAAAQKPDSSGYITARDGARLYYEIYGKARDTVIVPGAALLAASLAPLQSELTLVFYDPRGRGRSDWIPESKRLTMDNEVADLEAIREGLEISKAGLIGFSNLGLMAALYTLDYPTRVTRLAQLSPMEPNQETAARYAPAERKVRSDSAAARLARATAAASDTANFAAECKRWYDAYLPLYVGDTAVAANVSTEYCAHENETPKRFLWRNQQVIRSIGRRWDYTERAKAIKAPALVIQGDRDFAVSPDGRRRWAELIPDARLIMLSGAGHLTYAERGDRVIPALARFFSGQWPPEAMQLKTAR